MGPEAPCVNVKSRARRVPSVCRCIGKLPEPRGRVSSHVYIETRASHLAYTFKFIYINLPSSSWSQFIFIDCVLYSSLDIVSCDRVYPL